MALIFSDSPALAEIHDGFFVLPGDTPTTGNTPIMLRYPFSDRYADPYSSQPYNSPLYLSYPSNIKTSVEYNPENREYDIFEKVGGLDFRRPSYMTFEEFKESQFKKSTSDY